MFMNHSSKQLMQERGGQQIHAQIVHVGTSSMNLCSQQSYCANCELE